MSDASWKPDPNGRHDWRYWDGASWTDRVSDDGEQSTDPYDPGAIPPPPTEKPSKVAAAAKARSLSYRLLLLDRRQKEIFSAPFQSPDMAIRHADENQAMKLRPTVGSVLMRGATPHIVEWKTAIVLEIDDTTGETREYHRMRR
jgi:hypothetical protein